MFAFQEETASYRSYILPFQGNAHNRMTENDAHSALCNRTQRRPLIKDLSQSDLVSFVLGPLEWTRFAFLAHNPAKKDNGSKFVACLDQIQPVEGFR